MTLGKFREFLLLEFNAALHPKPSSSFFTLTWFSPLWWSVLFNEFLPAPPHMTAPFKPVGKVTLLFDSTFVALLVLGNTTRLLRSSNAWT